MSDYDRGVLDGFLIVGFFIAIVVAVPMVYDMCKMAGWL